MSFCINSVVSSLLKDFVVQPDYSAKREEIERHDLVVLKRQLTPNARGFITTHIYKIMFVTSDTVICQEVEKTCNGLGRFDVRKFELSEWDQWFDSWIDEDHVLHRVMNDCWTEGMRMYGANC